MPGIKLTTSRMWVAGSTAHPILKGWFQGFMSFEPVSNSLEARATVWAIYELKVPVPPMNPFKHHFKVILRGNFWAIFEAIPKYQWSSNSVNAVSSLVLLVGAVLVVLLHVLLPQPHRRHLPLLRQPLDEPDLVAADGVFIVVCDLTDYCENINNFFQ